MTLTVIIALVSVFEAVIIFTLGNVIKLCVRENVKLVRGVARSKNPEVFAKVYNEEFSDHAKHISLSAKQNRT